MEPAPSRTAMLAAVTRGNYRLSEAQPWILDDPFALMLVGPTWKDMSDHLAFVAPEAASPKDKHRERVAASSGRGSTDGGEFRQYVLLGVGLDSFVRGGVLISLADCAFRGRSPCVPDLETSACRRPWVAGP